ncbi:hypothetical protein SAMN05216230_102436 [Pseudomonas soli]|uniref:Uncharacterized protein n=1 Tax=Pseudomonas soli TaxID=1306993 RepID=A0A1H9F4M2_9PSED|nr:hypothetical protein SAMN05216230_102436 [Pseudomonas soli]
MDKAFAITDVQAGKHGFSQSETASLLNINFVTIKRHWNKESL